MPRRLTITTHAPIRGERGFTLLEVLVVMLVIGILAAIALPAFLGQQEKGKDAEAKSNARNLMSQVEACYSPREDFRNCGTEAELGATGIPFGPDPGEAEVVSTTQNTYTVRAVSKAKTGGANHSFTIERDVDGHFTRTCTGCSGGNW